MRFLCWFFRCRWIRVVNVSGPAMVPTKSDPLCQGYADYGLWQCTRCKTLSIGRVLGPPDGCGT